MDTDEIKSVSKKYSHYSQRSSQAIDLNIHQQMNGCDDMNNRKPVNTPGGGGAHL